MSLGAYRLGVMLVVAGIGLAACHRAPRDAQPDASPTTTTAASAATTSAPTIVVTPPATNDTPDPLPATTCAKRCGEPEDCPSIPCRCEDGSIVNARHCNNNCCESEMETCSGACKKHDGPKGTWNAARDGLKTGAACNGDRACASGVCLRGYCSRKCSTFGDCPPFWKCEASRASAFDRYCEKDD